MRRACAWCLQSAESWARGAQDRGGAGELRDTCAAHFDVRLEALVRAAQAQDAAAQE